MKKIKNIIFDLGNVIIDIDIPRTWDSLRHYLSDDMHGKLQDLSHRQDLFEDYELGLISETDFLGFLQQAANAPISKRQLLEAWNAMLLEITPKRFEMLDRLGKDYQLFVLSNTNQSHIDWVQGYLDYVYQIKDFEMRYFQKVWYSHEINLRKPNRNIYEFILQDAAINAAESLFIDDNADNIRAAQSLGINTILHPIGLEIADVIDEYITKI